MLPTFLSSFRGEKKIREYGNWDWKYSFGAFVLERAARYRRDVLPFLPSSLSFFPRFLVGRGGCAQARYAALPGCCGERRAGREARRT